MSAYLDATLDKDGAAIPPAHAAQDPRAIRSDISDAEPVALKRDLPAQASHAIHSADQLFLSVFLNLMAFFAVLVAVSEFETDKSAVAIQSIRGVFGESTVEVQSTFDDAGHVAGIRQGSARQNLATYIKRLAELQRVEAAETGDRIAISLPPQALFAEPGAALLESRNVLFVRMAALLTDRQANWQLKITVNRASNVDIENQSIQLRLENLLQHLQKFDMQPSEIHLSSSDSSEINFVFELVDLNDTSHGIID